jgi:hypothetical protein
MVMLKTHLVGIERDVRAASYHLESGPGIGKSAGTEQYCEMLAAEINKPVGLVVMMLASVESVDVRGFMFPAKRENGLVPGTVFTEAPWLPVRYNTRVVMPDGEWYFEGEWEGAIPEVGVLFLDEMSQADEDTQKAASELVYKGSVGSTHLPPHWRVISAGNRTSDKSGVVRQLKHMINRRGKLSVDPEVGPWLDWVQTLDADVRPHYLTVSFARKNPDIVFKDAIPDGDDQYATPRSLIAMDQALMALRTPEDIKHHRVPTDPIAREVCASWVGAASAAQYFVHVKYAEEVPDIADIERDPMKAKCGATKDIQMVTAFMLSHYVTKQNAAKVMTYVGRMHVDMQTLAVSTILAQKDKAADVIQTAPMVQWLAKNKDVLVAARA